MTATRRRAPRQLTFAVLASGVLAFALLQSLVIPVLPTIQAALHTTQADVTWVLTAYLLSASISTPIVGRLGDMTGKKRMFVVALSALALGCLLAAVATSLPVMIVARVIQGVGGGGMGSSGDFSRMMMLTAADTNWSALHKRDHEHLRRGLPVAVCLGASGLMLAVGGIATTWIAWSNSA